MFVKVSGVWSPGRTVKARPFDATTDGPPVKWAYATGGTAVAPPTVSGPGILALSNDRTVHALTRGSAGGVWPASWVPTALAGVAHSRSPVVPFTVPLNGADTVLFTADDATPGFLHAIDARTGLRPWPAQAPGLAMTGAPGGIFTQYGGVRTRCSSGTRDIAVDNELRALKLADGSLDRGLRGSPQPRSDRPDQRHAGDRLRDGAHLLRLVEPDRRRHAVLPRDRGQPALFTYKWSRNLGNITGSPVLRGGRVYVSTDAGARLLARRGERRGRPHDRDRGRAGQGLPVPRPAQRRPDLRHEHEGLERLRRRLVDERSTGSGRTRGLNPSLILYWPQTNLVYVGSANGKLYELDFTAREHLDAAHVQAPGRSGGGLGQVGAPSLDIGVTPQLLIVGSEPGVLYGRRGALPLTTPSLLLCRRAPVTL